MSSLYAKITNLFDQDFYNFEEGKPILDFLMKHKEDIKHFEAEYNAHIQIALEDCDEMQKENDKLGQQLLHKDKEIAELKTKLKIVNNVNDSFLDIIQNRKDFNEVVNEVLLQVKPIRLRKQIANDFFLLIAAKEQKTSHQVCEEIREFIHTKEYDQFGLEYLMNGSAVLEKLDQIEQRENKK